MRLRFLFSILLPFLACAIQWLLWTQLKPYVWFLFFPAAFFSAWIGGLKGGLAGTIVGALLVWYVFIPPAFSFELANPASGFSIGIFVFMGGLYAFIFDRLNQAKKRTDEALASAEAANEEITRLYQKTLELDKLKSQFFANVSHELRTPLTLIMAPLERRQHGADLSEAERHENEVMLRNARQLYRHVTDLLDAAKLESGRMSLNFAPVDLARLTRTMVSHFDSVATEHHVTYLVEAPDVLPAEADSEKLQRVLLNLLSNAFKFTPDGGAITVRLSSRDGCAVFEVEDNGPGVPADMRTAVFERFRQVDGETRRRYGGTGLGLAIVKDLVELHGGKVMLDDTPGGGARFSVKLPLTAPAGTVSGKTVALDEVIDRQAIEELGIRGKAVDDLSTEDAPLVLVVEDNADMNDFIAVMLRPYYRVITACNGREGLDKALASHPDLILSDIMMPLMSGDEMVIALRLQPGMENTPVIMLTAKADDELRLKLLKQGVQAYINKPFSTEELLARVDGFIQDRRRAASRLNESETRFKATFDQAAVGIALVAPNGRWLKINHKLCDIVGYSEEELLKLTFQDITYPDDLTTDLAYVQKVLSGEMKHYSMEERYFRKDRSLVWVNLTVALVLKPDGKPDYFISVIENIQERKEAEAALKESTEALRIAQHLAGIGNWTWNIKNNQHIWSEEIYRIYGRDPALPAAEYPEVQQYFTSESWTRLSAAVEKGVAEGISYQCDAEVVRPDGEHRWITARGEVTRDGDGHVIEMHGTVQDITERKQIEDEIRELNASLEQRVMARTAELTSANRELDAFSYAVSHDLRAPLRAMSGFSQALNEDYGSQLQGDAKVYLEQINLASHKMSDLIDGLLTLSRSTRGELKIEPIDISSLSEQILAELARAEPERKVTTQVEPGLQTAGDARMIAVVMQNLLSNAWKYSSRTENPCIRVYSEQQDGVRRYCVADNGAGFDMDHANRLFQPFQRLHRQEEFPGIGIGLATVQRIVHRHGGVIEATSKPGKGATFCYSLNGTKKVVS